MRERSEGKTVTVRYIPFAGSFKFSLKRVVIDERDNHIAGLRYRLCEPGIGICGSEVNLAEPLSQRKAQESPKIARTKWIRRALARLDERSKFCNHFFYVRLRSKPLSQMSSLLWKRRLHAQHEVDYTLAHFRRQRILRVPRRTSADHIGCGHSFAQTP